ncbi:E3 SUMO-protein ligase ZBED1-like [Planococcus citri]|uniref:E3 SUMO-protein ligase ZBED1-like n=1 Tax=Planococcus citri TaxID=170843 RepID=UPI0031F833EB
MFSAKNKIKRTRLYDDDKSSQKSQKSASSNSTLSSLKRSKFRRIFCLSGEEENDAEVVDDVQIVGPQNAGNGESLESSGNENLKETGSSELQNTSSQLCPQPTESLSKSSKKSIAEAFFDDYDLTHKKCKDCGKKIKKCGNTTNFISHAKSQHPVRYYAVSIKFGVVPVVESDSTSTRENEENPVAIATNNSVVDDAENFYQTKTTNKKSLSWSSVVQPTIRAIVNRAIPYPKDSEKRRELDKLLAIFITKTYQPLRIVEMPEFRNFVLKLNARYTLMSRKTLTESLLPSFYIAAKNKLMDMLSKADSIAVTTDCWTSCSNESFLGITVHFWEKNPDHELPTLQSRVLEVVPIPVDETAESLSKLLKETFVAWNIESKITAIVTDHAPNMKAAVNILKIRHLGCLAHSLNTIVKNCITQCTDNEIKSAIQKAKDIVTYFHHSAKGTRILKAVNELNLEDGELMPSKLKQYVETRWNTLYDMITSVIDNMEGINKVLIQIDLKNVEKILNDTEIAILKDIRDMIKPFKTATESISGDKYITISSVIPCIKGLRMKLAKIQTHSEATKNLLSTFISKTAEKLSEYETRTITRIATLLDPKYKKSGFCKPSNIDEAVKAAKSFIGDVIKEKEASVSAQVAPTSTKPANDEDDLYSFLDTDNDEIQRTPTVDATTLLDSFFLLEKLDKKSSVETCISNLKHKHPELYQVFMLFSMIPGSSVPCERLFSNTGYTMSDRRNRLASFTLNMLVFLNKNCDLIC